jgi:hypothetical protein
MYRLEGERIELKEFESFFNYELFISIYRHSKVNIKSYILIIYQNILTLI